VSGRPSDHPDQAGRPLPLLLACDLDGTLLDYEAAPVPGAGEAVAELVLAGATFVVVTGRPLQAARRATAALGVEPVVYACYHGALIADAGDRVLRHLPVPVAPGHAVVERGLAEGVGVTVWDVDEPRELAAGHDLSGEPGPSASRLVLHGDPVVVARLLGELREEWAGRLRVLPIRPGFIGVFAPEVDKGDALRFVAGRLGVPLGRTVACGDGTADESLLAAAAVRIAVGDEPHVLGTLPGVVVTGWARLPSVLRAQILPLL
jgi:hydroxymethylpyrimidine pyrophosphatase-like HAD family hydrolase